MKKSKHIGLFTAAFVLLAVSAHSAQLFYDDFSTYLNPTTGLVDMWADSDGKLALLRTWEPTPYFNPVLQNPGSWYQQGDGWGVLLATTNAVRGFQPPPDSISGTGLRVGVWQGWGREGQINTGLNYDVNTNYTFTFRTKLYGNGSETIPAGSATGMVAFASGFVDLSTEDIVWLKSESFINLTATGWQEFSLTLNGGRINTNAYGKPIIIEFAHPWPTDNSTNYFSWVDWVQIDGENPWADYVASEGLSSADRTADDDGDKIDNFTEWATGGNPKDPSDTGLSGSAYIWDDAGTNKFVHVSPQQAFSDRWPNGIDYYFESKDDLMVGSWTNVGSWTQGTDADAFGAGFDAVTNVLDTVVESNDMQFVRMRVDHRDYNP